MRSRRSSTLIRDLTPERLPDVVMPTCEAHAVLQGQKAAYLGPTLGISGVSYQAGTLRFDEDPRSSVLDATCRAHELDNLYATNAWKRELHHWTGIAYAGVVP